MARLLRMPGISADAEEVVFLEWCAKPGSEIRTGDAIATVETEKANVDIEADQDAVLWRTLIEPGQSVSVGSPVAVLVAIGEEVGDEAEVLAALGIAPVNPTPSAESHTVDQPAAPQLAPLDPPTAGGIDESHSATRPEGSNGRTFASPIARKLARENNVPIETVSGTGPGNRIVRSDIEKAIIAGIARSTKDQDTARSQTRQAAGFTDVPHTGMRRAIARSLTSSKREAPHFYLDATCHVDALIAFRRDINDESSVKISINDFILKAVARALADVPEMNVVWMDDCVRRFDAVDIAVAIGSDSGLVTPVIRSANDLTLTQISEQVRDFSQRANSGRLKQHELEGGSFSVSNLGMFGVERFSAILNPPQAGILAVGAITQQPIVVDDSIRVASALKVTLSVDHRPVDGVMAATWLARFKQLMEKPALMLA